MANIIADLTKNRPGIIKMDECGTEYLGLEKRASTAYAATISEVLRSSLTVNGTALDGFGQKFSFYMENDAGTLMEMAKLVVYATDVSDGSEDVAWKFYNRVGGALNNTLTITSAGSLSGVGDLTFTADQDVTMIDNNADAWAIKDTTGNEYVVFDTTTGTLRIELNQSVKVANTMNILAATVGGSTLGSTSAEWGSIYLASGKGVYFGSAQECNFLEASGALQLNLKDDTSEAFSIQTETGASEYFIITTSNGAETVSLGCTTADESAQDTTIQAGNDLVIRCGTTAADTVKVQAYDIDGAAYADVITIASHATDPTLTLAATGGITVSSATTFSSTIAAQGHITLATNKDLIGSATGTSDLGSTTVEWGDIYCGASKGISFGAAQEASIKAGAAGTLDVAILDNTAASFTISEGANAYLTITTTNNSELVTLAAVQDIVINAGATATDTLKLQAYDGAVATAMITLTSHATLPTLTLTSQGALTIENVTAASAGVNIAGPNNSATAFTVKEAANSYITIDTTTGSEIMTLGSEKAITISPTTALTLTNGNGANLTIQAGQTNADKLYLDAYDTTGAYDHIITITSANDPTISIAADGGITLASAVAIQGTVTMASGIDIICADTGSDLGSTAKEWGNVIVGNSKGMYFGDSQTHSLLHDGTTGLDLSIADNDAASFDIKEGASSYLKFVTTDNAEAVVFGKVARYTCTTVDMANAEHTLVWASAGANQTQITGNILIIDPNGGSQTLVLPTEATSTGVKLIITNSANAAETITIKDDAKGYTVCAVEQDEHAEIWCNGTVWYGGVLKET